MADLKLCEILGNLLCSDVSGLTWEEIASLRESKYFLKFVEKVNILRTQETQKPGMAEMTLLEDFFAFVGETLPSLSKSIIKGVVCNLPIPVLNPISIFESIRNIANVTKFERK